MPGLRILFLGDVVGDAGLRAVEARLPALAEEIGARLVVANGENAAGGGLGLTPGAVQRLHGAGVGVVTTGNHVWDKTDFLRQIDRFPAVVRPANYPPGAPGQGWCLAEAGGVSVAVLNLVGRVFMDPMDCPFRAADRILPEIADRARIILVDFHAEATSEKRALGWYLAGRVTAVVGTHTHVPTADAQVLPGGTGYVTDAGMTGVSRSVIGLSVERSVKRFLTRLPRPPLLAEGEAALNGVVVDADPDTGRCLSVTRADVPAA